MNNPLFFCCSNITKKWSLRSSVAQKAFGTNQRLVLQAPQVLWPYTSYSRKQIFSLKFFHLWPVIRPLLISQHLFIQQVNIWKTFYACVTRETERGETEIVMVWCDKVIRTPLRASLWMIQGLTGTAMLVINTLNYQGGNVCLCVSGFPWVCIPYTNGCLPNYVSNYQCGVLQMCVHSYTDSVYAFERK